MKKVLKILAFVFCFFCAFADAETIFDFSKKYDKDASNTLTQYVEQTTKTFCPEARANFYDMDNDNKKEIVGYAKNGTFYNLKGYKLLILKEADIKDADTVEIEGSYWKMLPSDVYFEPELPLTLDGNKVTFKQGDFYNNKKQSAKLKKDDLKANYEFSNNTQRRVKKIEETIEFTKNTKQHKMHLKEFDGTKQRNVNIHYDNLQIR